MYIPLTQYTINGVPHQIIRNEEDNIILEVHPVAGYEINIDEITYTIIAADKEVEE